MKTVLNFQQYGSLTL